MKSIKVSMLVMAIAMVGCTPFGELLTDKLATIGCDVVLSTTLPAAEPICASIDEVYQAVSEIEQCQAPGAPVVAPTSNGVKAMMVNNKDALYLKVLDNRSKKAQLKNGK